MKHAALAIMGALILLSACGEGRTNEIADQTAGLSIQAPGSAGATITARGPGGLVSSVTAGEGAPSLPAYVPQYPGSKPGGGGSTQVGGMPGQSITVDAFNYQTPDSVVDVADFYYKALSDGGVVATVSALDPTMTSISADVSLQEGAAEPGQSMLTIALVRSNDTTAIGVLITKSNVE